jgi:copper chaperone CopZ
MSASKHGGRRRAHAGVVLALLGVFALFSGLSACTSRPGPAAKQEASMKVVQIPVEAMSCAACVARVKKTLTSISGVSGVEVSLVERRARVRFDPSRLSPDQLVAAIKGLGYHASAPAEAR